MKKYDPPLSYEEWKQKEQERKLEEKHKKEMLHVCFPILSQIPLPWIIIGIVCVLFGIFTLIL